MKIHKRSWHTKKTIIYGKIMYPINKILYKHFGKNSVIYKPLCVNHKKYIHIGEDVQIRESVRMEAILHASNTSMPPKLYIGDHTHLEHRCQIFCAKSLHIGNYVTISSDVFITDVVHEYFDVKHGIGQQPLIAGSTYIADKAFIGTGVKIIRPVIIGEHAVIGANSVVTRDVPAYTVVAGAPAQIIKKYNFDTKEWESINKV